MLRVKVEVKRFLVVMALCAAALAALAACGGETPPAPQPGAPTAVQQNPVARNTPEKVVPKSGNTVGVILSEWTILPGNMGIPPGKVSIQVTNKGEVTHNLTIMQGDKVVGKTPNFKKDEGPKSLDLDLQPGIYKMVCDIPGHAEKGMTGILNVTK